MLSQSFISFNSSKGQNLGLLSYLSSSKKISICLKKTDGLKLNISGPSFNKILIFAELTSNEKILDCINLDLSTARSEYSKNESIMEVASKFNAFVGWKGVQLKKYSVRRINSFLSEDIKLYIKISILNVNDSFISFHTKIKYPSITVQSENSFNSSKSGTVDVIEFLKEKIAKEELNKNLYTFKYFNNITKKIESIKKENLNENKSNISSSFLGIKSKKYYIISIAKIKEVPL